MVQKISHCSSFIISVNCGMNIAWEDKQMVRGSDKRGRWFESISRPMQLGPSVQIIRRSHDALVETA